MIIFDRDIADACFIELENYHFEYFIEIFSHFFFFLEKNLLNKQTSNRKKEVRNEFCNAFLIELDFFGIDKRI